jgi:hypothetical protein
MSEQKKTLSEGLALEPLIRSRISVLTESSRRLPQSMS